MLKGDLISVVASRTSGEKAAGVETDVHKATIRTVIDILIRYFFIVDYRSAREDLRRFEGVEAVRTLSPVGEAFVTSTTLAIQRTKGAPFVDLPHLPLQTPGLHWLREVTLSAGEDQPLLYTATVEIIDSLRRLRGMPDHILEGTTYVYPQKHQAGYRLYYYYLNAVIRSCQVRYVRDPEGYADDEFMPLPGAIQAEILRWATDYFLGVRELPGDNIANDRDDAERQRR